MNLYESELIREKELFNNIPLGQNKGDLAMFIDYNLIKNNKEEWFKPYKKEVLDNIQKFENYILSTFELEESEMRENLQKICEVASEANYFNLGYSKTSSGKGSGLKILNLVDYKLQLQTAKEKNFLVNINDILSIIPNIANDCISDLILSLNYAVFSKITLEYINKSSSMVENLKREKVKTIVYNGIQEPSIEEIEIYCCCCDESSFLITPKTVSTDGDILSSNMKAMFRDKIFPTLKREMELNGETKVNQKKAINYFIKTRFSDKKNNKYNTFSTKGYSNPNKSLLLDMITDNRI